MTHNCISRKPFPILGGYLNLFDLIKSIHQETLEVSSEKVPEGTREMRPDNESDNITSLQHQPDSKVTPGSCASQSIRVQTPRALSKLAHCSACYWLLCRSWCDLVLNALCHSNSSSCGLSRHFLPAVYSHNFLQHPIIRYPGDLKATVSTSTSSDTSISHTMCASWKSIAHSSAVDKVRKKQVLSIWADALNGSR